MKKKLGIYIHIPFCIKKCHYCGFLSFDDKIEMLEGYTKALIREIESYRKKMSKEYEVDSIFFGGGTPTLAGPRNIKSILDAIGNWRAKDCEITLEGNPKTFNEEDLREYRRSGINRLSIGCQSIDNMILSNLGRIHSREDFLKAYEGAKKAGFDNINVDLMFAVPGQDMECWKDTLSGIIRLKPQHISFYSLQIEEGTPYYNLYKNDQLEQVSDEEERRMHHEAIRMVEDAGYLHYEISNAAMAGKECKHNLKYWSMEDYLGLGLGASSFVEGVRFKNTDSLEDYLKNEKVVVDEHINDQRDMAGELVFTGLRKREGFSKADFLKTVGISYDQYYRDIKAIREEYICKGFLVEKDDMVYLTEKGIDASNEIMAEFV